MASGTIKKEGFPTLTPLTTYAKFTQTTGGYSVIGNTVIVQIYTYVDSAFATNTWYTLTDQLPPAAVPATLAVSSNGQHDYDASCMVAANGEAWVFSGSSALTGLRLAITGVYIKA